MEKEKPKFTEADYKAQMEQVGIIFDEPIYIEHGNKHIEIRPLTPRTQVKISKYAIRQVPVEDVKSITKPDLMALAAKNLNFQAKIASLAILNDNRLYGFWGKFKRWFFFNIHWRMIMESSDNNLLNKIFVAVVEKYGLDFFFQNMVLVKSMNVMRKKMTKEEVESSLTEQKSE